MEKNSPPPCPPPHSAPPSTPPHPTPPKPTQHIQPPEIKSKKKEKRRKKTTTAKRRVKTNTEINKSTIGAAAEEGNIVKNCSGEFLNCRRINNSVTRDTVFLFTIRFDATERRVKIRETCLLLMPRCMAHIWCCTANPPNTAKQTPLQNDCNAVSRRHTWIVSGRCCQLQVAQPCEISTLSPPSKRGRLISQLLRLLK